MEINQNFLGEKLRISTIKSNDKIMLFAPVTNLIMFLCILPDDKQAKIITEWYIKNLEKLEAIFQI
ncbi:MAG: hypothetical protein ACTSR8_03395 [Promethearchaeota archaeon]